MHHENEADDVTRSLPHSVGAEKSVLSSMFQDPREYVSRAIERGISAGHFYFPAHSVIYERILEINSAGEEIDLVTFVQSLLDTGKLDRAGGPSAITDIYTYSPSPGHFDQHLRIVMRKAMLREVIRVSNESIAAAFDNPDEPERVLDAAEAGIGAIRDGAKVNVQPTTLERMNRIIDAFQERCRGEKKAHGIPSGYQDLDRKIGGFKPGRLYVLAARPSMGKTSLMMNLVEHVCLDEENPTMVFSCEMPGDAVLQRLAFARARYHDRTSMGIQADKGELQRIQRAAIDVGHSSLYVDDTSGISINELRSKARRKKRENGLGFIAIDYLQLMRSYSKQAAGSREREIAEISAGLKGIAKELEIPVLVLAQINRDADKRTGKSLGIPRMSDLRESGAIEQDADVIGMLYRPDYYAVDDAEKAALAGRAKLLIAKNREGETGTVPLTFIPELMKFESAQWRDEDVPKAAPKQPGKRGQQ